MVNEYPKLLVISNNSLSENNSNGRTLSGFLRGWDKDKIAQIYISGELPNSLVCERFFRITDKAVLKSILKKERVGEIVKNSSEERVLGKTRTVSAKKTIASIVARDMLWGTNVWWNRKLKEWIKDFSPDVILFFAGESVFTYKMGMKIAKFCDVPIVVYNSEGYYFKKKNYLKSDALSELIYPFFHKNFKRIFKKLMKKAVHTVYINDKLKKDYDKELGLASTTIYTASELRPVEKLKENETPIISYLGNLGIGRHIALIEIAQALESIDPTYKLNVYGKIPNDEVKNAFDNCSGINYCGLVPYSEVVRIMHESDILVHGEAFDDFTVWDLQYAFTTKIADSLSCGTAFFVYAPEELACTQYLLENECACVVTKKAELKQKLETLINDDELRKQYIQKGLEIANKNHNSRKNCDEFQRILKEVVR